MRDDKLMDKVGAVKDDTAGRPKSRAHFALLVIAAAAMFAAVAGAIGFAIWLVLGK